MKIDRAKFEQLVRPLVQYLNEEHHPHVTVIVTSTSAEMVSGECYIPIKDYIKD